MNLEELVQIEFDEGDSKYTVYVNFPPPVGEKCGSWELIGDFESKREAAGVADFWRRWLGILIKNVEAQKDSEAAVVQQALVLACRELAALQLAQAQSMTGVQVTKPMVEQHTKLNMVQFLGLAKKVLAEGK